MRQLSKLVRQSAKQMYDKYITLHQRSKLFWDKVVRILNQPLKFQAKSFHLCWGLHCRGSQETSLGPWTEAGCHRCGRLRSNFVRIRSVTAVLCKLLKSSRLKYHIIKWTFTKTCIFIQMKSGTIAQLHNTVTSTYNTPVSPLILKKSI